MQHQHSFEYAVIRLVPQMEREEFINTGVILYCKEHQFLDIRYTIDVDRLKSINPYADVEEIGLHLRAYAQIAKGDPEAGTMAGLDIASRFRWLTARRSTIVQSSSVHPGLCEDPEKTLNKLFDQLVVMH